MLSNINVSTPFIKGTSMENFEITVIDINNDQSMADIRAKVSSFPYSKENIEKPFKIFIDHAFESKGMSIAESCFSSLEISSDVEISAFVMHINPCFIPIELAIIICSPT